MGDKALCHQVKISEHRVFPHHPIWAGPLVFVSGKANICHGALSPGKLRLGKDILWVTGQENGSASHLLQLPQEIQEQEKGHAGEPAPYTFFRLTEIH